MAKPSQAEQLQVIDEYGELDRQVRAFKPTAEKHAKLKTEIQGWYEKSTPDATDVLEGRRFSVQVSARGNERRITNMLRVYKILGMQTFLEHCKIALSVVEKLIDPSKYGSFLEETQTGPRRLTAVAKAAPAAIAA